MYTFDFERYSIARSLYLTLGDSSAHFGYLMCLVDNELISDDFALVLSDDFIADLGLSDEVSCDES